MTTEPPPSSSGRPRPDAAARRRALGLEDGDAEAVTADAAAGTSKPAADAPVPAAARRESLRDSLARIPDLSPDEPLPTSAVAGSAGAATPARSSAAGPSAKRTEPAPSSRPSEAPAPSTAKRSADGVAGIGAPAAAGVAAGAGAAAKAGDPPGSPTSPVTPGSKAPSGTEAADAPSVEEEQGLDFEQRLAVAFSSPTPPPESAPDVASATAATPAASADAAGPGDPELVAAPAAHGGGRSKPPMWRRIAFAIVIIGLVAAIPALGAAGYQLISESKDGTYTGTTLSPTDPGYEAQVDSTPTAVAIQFDGDKNPIGVTFMSLAGGEGGGSVIFVPLDTEVSEPSYGVDTLRKAYDVVADKPTVARERLASQVGRLLNVGVDEIIDMDNAGWEQLVAPVAPLTIDNPDEIDLGYGQIIPTGETQLTAGQTGAYLGTTIEGESDLNRMNRHEAVWSAWLEQLAASGKAEAVPGESTAGISKFAQALANGPVTFSTLPVNPVDEAPGTFRIDESAANQLITDTVASPTAAVPGSRFTVRLLNGVAAGAIPSDIVRQIVSRGGAVTILGNGPQFDTDETTIVYSDPAKKDLATLVATSLGATGKVRLDREAPDTVDLTIVLGKDVLGDATGSGSPGATTPETTAAGGN